MPQQSKPRWALVELLNLGWLWGLWFLFAASAKVSEAVVGLGAAVTAAVATTIVESRRFAQFAPQLRWLLLFLLEPWYALTGSIEIFRALGRRIVGEPSRAHLKVARFEFGQPNDARDAARRALALALATIPPNFIVIGIDPERGLMLIHQVAPGPVPWVVKRIGAQE